MKRFISLVLLAMMLLSAIPMSVFASEEKLPFGDVKEDQWFYEAVKYSYENGIFKGTNTAGTTFSPNRTMTRIEFATTLFRLSGADEAQYKGESKFPDVPSNHWMTAPANWAAEKGYVLGNQKGEFMPNVTLDRQTLATMIYRYAADQYETMTARQTAFDRFGDKDETASWAKEAMTWVVTVELINGTGKTVKGAPTLAPKMAASRAQVAQILMSYANLRYNEEYPVGDIFIGENSIRDYIIVYALGHQNPAADLQKYIKQATGFELLMLPDLECGIGEKEILIGQTNREGVTVNVDRSECENDNDAFIIEVQNGNLIFASNEKHNATHFAVIDFLENFAGVSFLGTVETIKPAKAYYVPANYKYFETTPVDYRLFNSPTYGNEIKWKIAETNYSGIGFYHSLPSFSKDPSEFQPTWEYQVEYHKTSDGCLTDPKIRENIKTNVRTMLSKYSGNYIWVAQSDGADYCNCANCRTYYRDYGRFGIYLDIANMIAKDIDTDYPDMGVLGFCYGRSWSMIKGFDKNDIDENVIVCACTNTMCATHSIDDPDCKNSYYPNTTITTSSGGGYVSTKEGYKDCLDALLETVPTVWVWDYTFPADHNEYPLPIFYRLYDNVKYFIDNGVTGVYLQGYHNNHDVDTANFEELKGYLYSKLLRDGATMTEEEYWDYLDGFLKEYYGDGWTYIREYIDTLQLLQNENEWHIWTKEKWYDIITEEQYRANFDYLCELWEKAEALAQTEEMKFRVGVAATQMEYIRVALAYEDYMDSAKTDADLELYNSYRYAYIDRLNEYGLKMPHNIEGKLNPTEWRYA